MGELVRLDKRQTSRLSNEPGVSAFADQWLRAMGYDIRHVRSGHDVIDKAWPSKTRKASSSGQPDMLVYATDSERLLCVWENKATNIPVETALKEAMGYVAGLHQLRPGRPGLPRLAAGFNGTSLRLAYFNHEGRWVDVKASGDTIVDAFPLPTFAATGISASGAFQGVSGTITRAELRAALPRLKTLYRGISELAAGRKPIDFTVALLTLKMLLESTPAWGTWAEQPALVVDAKSIEHAVAERFTLLVRRVMDDRSLSRKYGDIFEFREHARDEPIAFDFLDTLKRIGRDSDHFQQMFQILDGLAPLHGADFDIFGEVYQAIGDGATKRALGEFFTGRHIIAALIPVLFERAGVQTIESLENAKIADIACGTGGFLTETLRYVRRKFQLDDGQTRAFAQRVFCGYDLSAANASRARVNMYFAGDGFSVIEGGFDTLSKRNASIGPFDYALTNPPYGAGSGGRLEEAFLGKVLDSLKPGGWGLVVLPTGTLENPRSESVRLKLLREAQLTDVIALPMHAFAPYTKQRTAVVIFRRRAVARPEGDWTALLSAIGHEEVSFFIVDNDGYANSDKRYETDRRHANGAWEHDDLRDWIDIDGRRQPGKLFASLIRRQAPPMASNEFGELQGQKYGVFKLSMLGAAKGKNLTLLPDAYLRPEFAIESIETFDVKARSLIKEANGATGPGSILVRARQLLATRVAVPPIKEEHPSARVCDVFHINKGTTGLTEAVIYRQFDPEGLPVYGGGEGVPRFKLAKGARNKMGEPILAHCGPALIVSLDGSSGAVRVIEKGEFVLNHHGCVLKPKPGMKIDLYYAAQQLEGGLRALAANRGASATLTLPKLKACEFPYPVTMSTVKTVRPLRFGLETIRDRYG